jgi:very-short-patch-repair endonuclease
MKHQLPMYYGAAMELFKYAEQMRYAPTEAEAAAWLMLSSNPFKGYRFRRQHPLATYIADFYSHSLRMVIEIDGGYHLDKEQKKYDDFRDEDTQELGIAVIRFTNDEIMQNLILVSERLSDAMELRIKQLLDQVSYPSGLAKGNK